MTVVGAEDTDAADEGADLGIVTGVRPEPHRPPEEMMGPDDRFSTLRPQGIITTIASLEERFRSAFEPFIGKTADDLAALRTADGSILDEVVTAASALRAATAAIGSAAGGSFPAVPPTVLGLEPFPTATATGTVGRHLTELGAEAARLVDTLKAIPRQHWGRSAYADDRPGHATIERLGQQAARSAVEALSRIEAVTGPPPL